LFLFIGPHLTSPEEGESTQPSLNENTFHFLTTSIMINFIKLFRWIREL